MPAHTQSGPHSLPKDTLFRDEVFFLDLKVRQICPPKHKIKNAHHYLAAISSFKLTHKPRVHPSLALAPDTRTPADREASRMACPPAPASGAPPPSPATALQAMRGPRRWQTRAGTADAPKKVQTSAGASDNDSHWREHACNRYF